MLGTCGLSIDDWDDNTQLYDSDEWGGHDLVTGRADVGQSLSFFKLLLAYSNIAPSVQSTRGLPVYVL